MDQKPHHHIILWMGVGVFTALIVVFWAMGLPDMFKKGVPAKNPLTDSKNSWDEIFKQAAATQHLISEPKNSGMAPEETITTQLKTLLGEGAQAGPLQSVSTTTSTP